MPLLRSCSCVLVILSVLLAGQAQSSNFAIIPVARDIYAAIAKPGIVANGAFIVNQDDVVVVDTQLRPSWASEVISDIRKITNKPVRYVINTHWHRDHVQGNQAYLDAFGPGVVIIQQEFAREDQIKNQPNELKTRAPEEISRLQRLIAANKDENGHELAATGRSRLEKLLAEQKDYLSETPNIRLTPGTLTFAKSMVLHERNRENLPLLFWIRSHSWRSGRLFACGKSCNYWRYAPGRGSNYAKCIPC